MKYIKKFENNAEYQTFVESAEYIEPHVSLSVEENEVHYNKVPEPPQTPKWIATYTDSHTESAECDSSGEIGFNEIPNGSNVVSLEISDCVTSIGDNAFTDYHGLTSVAIPNSVTTIGSSAFAACSGLTSVVIPSSVISIDSWAFSNCSGLTSITVNATTPPTLGANAFYNTNCPIYVPAESVDAYKAAEGWSEYADRIQPIV